jgi:hypothetical protein
VVQDLAFTRAEYIEARGGLTPNGDTPANVRSCVRCERVLPAGTAGRRYCSPRCQREAKRARARDRVETTADHDRAEHPALQRGRRGDVESVAELVAALVAAGPVVELTHHAWRLTASSGSQPR